MKQKHVKIFLCVAVSVCESHLVFEKSVYVKKLTLFMSSP